MKLFVLEPARSCTRLPVSHSICAWFRLLWSLGVGAAGGHDRYAASCLASSADRPEPNRAEPDVNVPTYQAARSPSLTRSPRSSSQHPQIPSNARCFARRYSWGISLATLSALEEDEDR